MQYKYESSNSLITYLLSLFCLNFYWMKNNLSFINTAILFCSLLATTDFSFSQSYPWERPLIICYSNNGQNFSNCSTFVDSSGVPCVCMDSSGRLVSAFQWFPAPFQGPHWDSVAVKISNDGGLSWSAPQPITVTNLPLNFQRPFDPTVVALPGGQIRIYFSSGPPGPNMVSTYSAIGTDGVNYTFEPGIRFSQAGRNIIDPAVVIFQGVFHYTSPVGAPQLGVFHATSTDGLNFTQQPDIPSDNNHQWTGNMMVDSLALKFYGTGAMGFNMWFRSTPDVLLWDPYTPLNISGGDPAVVKVNGTYIIIYTGPPYPNGIEEVMENYFSLYPNPVERKLAIGNLQFAITGIEVYDVIGENRLTLNPSPKGEGLLLDVSSLSQGIYFVKVRGKKEDWIAKFVKR